MCSNVFCLAPEEVDIVYFIILLITNLLNCLIALASIWLIARRVIRRRRLPVVAPGVDSPISVVMPCYLPNEHDIVEFSIDHIMFKLEYPGPLTLFLVFNSPHPHPLQARLHELDGKQYAPGRVLRVVEAAGSRSKAENLNVVLKQIHDKLVVLYDADHRPDPDSLMMMLDAMHEHNCHAVQGSTYIRNVDASVLGKIVNAEFFVTHFVYFPAMELMSGTGYFGGSNALWRTEVLRTYGFDAKMHTEDVDLSARIILDNHRVHFCPAARSGELSPAGFKALMIQRLRWFVGWEQVTRKYYWTVFFSRLRLPRRLGFCYMFHLRWGLLLAALMGAVINPVITSPFIYPLPTWSLAIQSCVYTAVTLYLFVALFTLCTCIWHERGRPSSWLWVAAFFVFGWLYVAFHFTLQTIALIQVLSGHVGEWTVTRRSKDAAPPAHAVKNGKRKGLLTPSNGHIKTEALQILREPLLDSREVPTTGIAIPNEQVFGVDAAAQPANCVSVEVCEAPSCALHIACSS